MTRPALHIIALAAHGPGLSGGDRIFIELARRWGTALDVTIHVEDDGLAMCERNRLASVRYRVISAAGLRKLGFAAMFLFKTVKACLTLPKRLSAETGRPPIILSASEFWPDSLPAFLAKVRHRQAYWIASWYQFAPSPLRGFGAGSRSTMGRLREFAYFVAQAVVLPLIVRFADVVFVTNERDREWFVTRGFHPDRVLAVRGGVDTALARSIPEPPSKDYDAVFIGRLHPQKGILQLLDIWKEVCVARPGARLAIIGDGPLEKAVARAIGRLNLQDNVAMLGFSDGEDKMRVFKRSRVVVHPAVYDSGGMAACEAMACGLPAVSFDLESLQSYYPRGVLKTPCFDKSRFAQNILDLLSNEALYRDVQRQALDFAQDWDWNRRADELLEKLRPLLQSVN